MADTTQEPEPTVVAIGNRFSSWKGQIIQPDTPVRLTKAHAETLLAEGIVRKPRKGEGKMPRSRAVGATQATQQFEDDPADQAPVLNPETGEYSTPKEEAARQQQERETNARAAEDARLSREKAQSDADEEDGDLA